MKNICFGKFNIVGISSQLGENEIRPSDLFSDDDGRISNKTGINILHRSNKNAFELAIEATRENNLVDELKNNIEFQN